MQHPRVCLEILKLIISSRTHSLGWWLRSSNDYIGFTELSYISIQAYIACSFEWLSGKEQVRQHLAGTHIYINGFSPKCFHPGQPIEAWITTTLQPQRIFCIWCNYVGMQVGLYLSRQSACTSASSRFVPQPAVGLCMQISFCFPM